MRWKSNLITRADDKRRSTGDSDDDDDRVSKIKEAETEEMKGKAQNPRTQRLNF